MKNIDEIKQRILEEIEKTRKLKEEEKLNKKKSANEARDNEYASNWQKRYIDTKKKEGKTQVSIFLYKDNLHKIDSEIVSEAKNNNKKLNRSDMINKALEYYFDSMIGKKND